MRALTVKPKHSSDASYYVGVQVTKYNGQKTTKLCYLFEHDGAYTLLSSGACISSSYSENEKAKIRIQFEEVPLLDGDKVLIDGEIKTVHINGDFSDCATLS